jgi:hypothetical protein
MTLHIAVVSKNFRVVSLELRVMLQITIQTLL